MKLIQSFSFKFFVVAIFLLSLTVYVISSRYRGRVDRYTDMSLQTEIAQKNINVQQVIKKIINPRDWPQDRFTSKIKRQVEPIEKLVYDLAPLLWWHPQEKFKASDPLEFIRHSELIAWKKSIIPYYSERHLLKKIGEVTPVELAQNYSEELWRPYELLGQNEGHQGVALRFHAPSSIKKVVADTEMQMPPPLFWRVSRHPQILNLKKTDENSILLMIEYWYHIDHNPLPFYLGSHQGDWESFAYLVYFNFQNNSTNFSAEVLGLYMSAHGRGQWICPEEIKKKSNRYELLSSLGTHATYAHEGEGHLGLVADKVQKGSAWKTWNWVMPVQLEPYYGYTGAWGDVSDWHWSMTGPMPPSPNYKYLPKEIEIQFKFDLCISQNQ